MSNGLTASLGFQLLYSRSALTRRVALKLSVASAVLAGCARAVGPNGKHVAVIGGGIVGASIAFHLASAGVRVTLLDRGDLATQASRGTFAWINATWAKQPRAYHRFNQDGLVGWKRLEAELGIPVRWGGSVEWFPTPDRQARLEDQIDEQIAWGEDAAMIDADALRELEPNIDLNGAETVAYSANDGAVDPVLATKSLARAAEAMGAKIQINCSVDGVEQTDDNRIILKTCNGDIIVDEYVLATGADPEATETLAGIEIPQRTTPGVIVLTQPMPRLINRIIVAPGVHIHQRNDGRIVLGEQDGAPDTAAHAERLQDRPTSFPNNGFASQHAMRILAIAEQYVPGILEAKIEDVFIGWRPLPIDGHPVIGRSPVRPSAYLAIMHSGVSLAPIVGELVAQEIVSGQSAEILADYRPDRDFSEVRRY